MSKIGVFYAIKFELLIEKHSQNEIIRAIFAPKCNFRPVYSIYFGFMYTKDSYLIGKSS